MADCISTLVNIGGREGGSYQRDGVVYTILSNWCKPHTNSQLPTLFFGKNLKWPAVISNLKN